MFRFGLLLLLLEDCSGSFLTIVLGVVDDDVGATDVVLSHLPCSVEDEGVIVGAAAAAAVVMDVVVAGGFDFTAAAAFANNCCCIPVTAI